MQRWAEQALELGRVIRAASINKQLPLLSDK